MASWNVLPVSIIASAILQGDVHFCLRQYDSLVTLLVADSLSAAYITVDLIKPEEYVLLKFAALSVRLVIILRLISSVSSGNYSIRGLLRRNVL